MKSPIKFFSPNQKWKLPVIILMGVFLGLATYSVYVSKAWSYLSDKSENCINCHIMVPQYDSWRHSSHRENATCVDCHTPQDNVFRKYLFKAKDGFNHARIFTLRQERQAIIIGEEGELVVQQNCIRCHENVLDRTRVASMTQEKFTVHNRDRQCWECHREVPHGKKRSLSSNPNAIVPTLGSPVPAWLKEFSEKDK